MECCYNFITEKPMECHPEARLWRTNYEVIQDIGCINSFACFACYKFTIGKEAVLQGDKKYCWKCFEKLFGFKCASCLKPISGVNKLSFVVFNRQLWHRECFCCSLCGKSLEDLLIQENNRIYCKGCGETDMILIGYKNI